MSGFSSNEIRFAVDSANDRGLNSFMFQEPSSNRRRTQKCGCRSCNQRRTSRNRCTSRRRQSIRNCRTEPGRGSVWFPNDRSHRHCTSRRRRTSANERRSCNRRSSNRRSRDRRSTRLLRCTCRVRHHSHHNHCRRRRNHRNSFNWSNFLF